MSTAAPGEALAPSRDLPLIETHDAATDAFANSLAHSPSSSHTSSASSHHQQPSFRRAHPASAPQPMPLSTTASSMSGSRSPRFTSARDLVSPRDVSWQARLAEERLREAKDCLRWVSEGGILRGVFLSHYEPSQGWLLGSMQLVEDSNPFLMRFVIELPELYPESAPPRFVCYLNHHAASPHLEARLERLRVSVNREALAFHRLRGKCLVEVLRFLARTVGLSNLPASQPQTPRGAPIRAVPPPPEEGLNPASSHASFSTNHPSMLFFGSSDASSWTPAARGASSSGNPHLVASSSGPPSLVLPILPVASAAAVASVLPLPASFPLSSLSRRTSEGSGDSGSTTPTRQPSKHTRLFETFSPFIAASSSLASSSNTEGDESPQQPPRGGGGKPRAAAPRLSAPALRPSPVVPRCFVRWGPGNTLLLGVTEVNEGSASAASPSHSSASGKERAVELLGATAGGCAEDKRGALKWEDFSQPQTPFDRPMQAVRRASDGGAAAASKSRLDASPPPTTVALVWLPPEESGDLAAARALLRTGRRDDPMAMETLRVLTRKMLLERRVSDLTHLLLETDPLMEDVIEPTNPASRALILRSHLDALSRRREFERRAWVERRASDLLAPTRVVEDVASQHADPKICSVCRMLITKASGYIFACPKCHHGGHLHHLEEWWAACEDGARCPAPGCLCKCTLDSVS